MPGLINCHTHLPMYLLRGYADDLNLQDWLEHYIFPREDRLDGRAVKAATTLAIAECVCASATTSVSGYVLFLRRDLPRPWPSPASRRISPAARPCSWATISDFDTFPACRELVELKDKWHNYDNGRIKIEASIHAEYTSTYQLWDALAEYAINNGLQLQVHLSETKKEHDECVEKYGLTPAQVLDCHHVFDVPTVAAHCVHVTQEDMQLLAKRHVSAAHCPVSNLKLASGCADVLGMVKAGMNVASARTRSRPNNNLDLFEEIKRRCRSWARRAKPAIPTALPAEAALDDGDGLRRAGAGARAPECGMLRGSAWTPTSCAAGLHRSRISFPCHNVLSHVWSTLASGHDVALTHGARAESSTPTANIPTHRH
ncbi:MAG: amidohydrolase family protein [Blautia wexlerae]